MANGVFVALLFHKALYDEFWKEQGVDLILPWGISISLLIFGWIFVILATMVPLVKATKITPAEALSSND